MLASRRTVLAFGCSALVLSACTQAQVDATLAEVKKLSADLVAKTPTWFADIPLAGEYLEGLKRSNDSIQKATSFAEIASGAGRALTDVLSALIGLAAFAPIPSTVVEALKIANSVLGTLMGRAATPVNGRVPTMDEALVAVAAIPAR